MKNNNLFRMLTLLIIVCLFTSLAILIPSSNPIYAAVDDSYTVSLLHFNGANGMQTFTDESGKTWTAHGAAYTDTTVYKFGSASGNFPGSSNWIDVPDNSDFHLGSGDFTIDFWMRLSTGSSGSEQRIAGQMDSSFTLSSVSFYFYKLTDNTLNGGIFAGSNSYIAHSDTALSENVWYHIALIRNANILTLYINGIAGSTTKDLTGITVNNSSAHLSIGRLGDYADTYFTGFIDEFRLSKGVARWTTNFTPPTAEYPDAAATATAAYNQTATSANIQTATSSAATSTAQYNLDLTATSNAATATALAGANSSTQTEAYYQTSTAAAITQTAIFDLTQTALSWTPTFTATSSPISTASLTPTLGTPLAMGTMYWDSRVTYGEYATTVTNMIIIIILVVAFTTWMIVTVLDRKGKA